MRIGLIAFLSAGVRFILAAELSIAINEETEVITDAPLTKDNPNPGEAISVTIAPNPHKFKPLYSDIPSRYEYPASIETFIISQNRDF